jgi:hypothetical protein
MSQMKTKILIPAAIALIGVSGVAAADKPDDDGDVTIRLMPHAEAELPDAVTNPIELPEHLLEDAQNSEKLTRAKQAIDHANERRTAGPNHGLSHAQEAREQGREMAENAKAKNEDRGRSEGRPDRPDPADRPDPPGPPETPPGQN